MRSKSIKHLWGILKNKIILPTLTKLAIRFKVFIYKRALKFQLLLFNKLKYQLRLINPDLKSEGFAEQLYTIIHIAAYRMANPEIFNLENNKFLFQNDPDSLIQKYLDIKCNYEKYKNDINQLIDCALENPRIRSTIEKYFIVESFLSNQIKNDRASQYYLKQARTYNPKASIIDFNSFFKSYKETKKEVRQLKNEVSDKEAIKFTISLSNIGVFITIVSTFFLITGYLYNYFLLGHFGIEISRYFTLSDYLGSSIDGIRYSALAAAIALVFFFIGMHSSSRKLYAQIEIEKKPINYIPYIIIVIISVPTFILYLKDEREFYFMVYLIILFLMMIVAPWISKRYFKNPIITLASIVFIMSFSAHLFLSIGEEIYQFEHKNIVELRRYEIVFKKKPPFDAYSGESCHLFR